MSENRSNPSLLGKIAEYTEILDKDPQSTSFVPLSEAYRRMGMLDDALEIASRGVRNLPGHGPGYVALGRVQAQIGALQESIASFAKALEIDGTNLFALTGLARVQTLLGNRGEARSLLQRAVALRPADQAVRDMLASLGPEPVPEPPPDPSPFGGESAQPSAPESSRPPRGMKNPLATATMAEIYIQQGFWEQARGVFLDLLAKDPENGEIRSKLADLEMRMAARVDPEGGEVQPMSEAPSPSGTAALQGEPRPAKQTPLEVLQCWLESIARRREHVQ